MTRPDLLALTPDSLAALANRGLVKRATKELDAGTGPSVEVADDTVHGTFADGVVSSLPPGVPLDAAPCSCGAAGVCRHRIALVLAYQRAAEEPAAEVAPWSPGSVTDEELTKQFGQRAVQQARRTLRSGYPVAIRRPVTAELPTCTVRFLVPGDLGYVHTDATAARRDESIVLAVWAFREADTAGLTGDAKLDVGGGAAVTSDLSQLEDLLDQLLTDGAVHAGPVLDAAWRRLQRDLTAQHMHWPAAAIEDLLDQLDAYRKRSAEYRAERFAELLTELHARSRGTGPRSEVLGTDEPAETPLRRVRLTALGCRVNGRVNGTADTRTADVYFASGDMVLVHRDAPMRTATRTATANVVSESVSRSASRVLRLRSGRVGQTSVTPVGTSWHQLPEPLLVRDLAAYAETLDALPPRVVRARIAAELVRVVEVREVRHVGYDPAAQHLEAILADAAGTTATLSATYRGVCPQSLDALAEALSSSPTHISGTLRRVRGGIMIDPLAVLTSSGVVVPDLAAASPADLPYSVSTPDLVSSAVDDALTVLADAAHRGLRDSLPPRLRTRLAEVADDLDRAGLRGASGLVRAFTEKPAPASWLAAHLRVLVTAERR
ncbi:hypothetical protein [Kibdelosporangium aridum]|uniref:SWIM-type domain-containing protein n=1 Tax=Kibdelosporangium aridum TaxID=2030 RepID=A0A1W2BLW3_KIBAR|nr:hypothetical protein [Kibdelosporangium aridum]SMC73939.1 hypothetical protein SAMN05661093_01815 [Kibdelosporangium aridum]